MKNLVVFFTLLATQVVHGQQSRDSAQRIANYFKAVQTATKSHVGLWNRDIYGPIIFADPQTREIYTNEQGLLDPLTSIENIYTGIMPDSVNIANTTIHWNGRKWALILLPLPENGYDQIDLITHELFHSMQENLGFTQPNYPNNHLGEKNGRIYLRLELEALQAALTAGTVEKRNIHITNALVFRKYRHIGYPGSDTLENRMEINEGLAKYTGVIMSGRNEEEMRGYFKASIDKFFKYPSYVGSFALFTTPVYGYLARQSARFWNRKITDSTDLTEFFIDILGLTLPPDLEKHVNRVGDPYDRRRITAEETAREERIASNIKEYRRKLVEQPHVEIQLISMNISFNPSNILPIGDKGTFYPTMRVTDDWGILTIKNGALMSPDWDKISITLPTAFDDNVIKGDGWTLELNDGFKIQKDDESGNYSIINF